MGDIFADMKVTWENTLPDIFMNLIKMTDSLGALITIDDLKDYGKFSTADHPSMIHHWWVGEILQQVAEMAGAGLVMWQAKDAIDREEKAEVLESFNFHAYNDILKLGRR